MFGEGTYRSSERGCASAYGVYVEPCLMPLLATRAPRGRNPFYNGKAQPTYPYSLVLGRPRGLFEAVELGGEVVGELRTRQRR